MKKFFKNNIIIGLFAVLPVIILLMILEFVYNFLYNIMKPVTCDLLKLNRSFGEVISGLISVALMLAILFFLGAIIKTKFGKYFFNFIEKRIFSKIPGYNIIKDTVSQFKSDKNSATVFKRIGFIDIFGNGNLMTGFVTDESETLFTIFVPTGPNPTTGFIYHVKKENFTIIKNTKIEEAFKSIVSCGIGSKTLLEKYEKEKLKNNIKTPTKTTKKKVTSKKDTK